MQIEEPVVGQFGCSGDPSADGLAELTVGMAA